MIRRINRNLSRRGASQVQYVVMAAIILLAVIAAVRTLGTNARTSVNSAAGNVADPSSLPARFGS